MKARLGLTVVIEWVIPPGSVQVRVASGSVKTGASRFGIDGATNFFATLTGGRDGVGGRSPIRFGAGMSWSSLISGAGCKTICLTLLGFGDKAMVVVGDFMFPRGSLVSPTLTFGAMSGSLRYQMIFFSFGRISSS